MTDDDVVIRAALFLETSHLAPPHRREAHHKSIHVARVRGQRAIEVMQALYPMLGSRRQGQIDAAIAARSLRTYRIPYATEVAEMVDLKAAGVSRGELAQRYGIGAKSVNRLVRGSVRSRDVALAQAAKIQAAETRLAGAVKENLELAWLAGIIEGEGSFGANVSLRVHMTDEDVMNRVASMMGTRIRFEPSRRATWKPTWCAAIGGSRAIRLLEQLEPTLGQRRQQQTAAMRETLATRPGRGAVPPSRMVRNLEIARRLAAGETGPVLAAEYGMTHQNVYFIGRRYKDTAVCPRGEGSACKAEYTGSNPVAAST